MNRKSNSNKPRIKAPASKGAVLALPTTHFLEAIPDAIVAVDQQGTILEVNSLTESLFGHRKGELIGRSIETLVPERYRTTHHQHRHDFGQQPKVRRMGEGLELYGRRKDGSEFPVEISLSPVQTEGGMLVLSAIRDISDRKRIEQELRKAHRELSERTDREIWEYRSRLALIIDSSQDAIIGKDVNGIVTSWNQGAQHMYGYTAAEMLGQSISILSPKDRPDEIPKILETIRRGETVQHYETVRVSKDGHLLIVSISVSPIRDSEGVIVGASVIARNITEQKRAQEQLRQSQKMEAVGRLAGGVAHDFNNVLGIITACTDLLSGRIDGNPKITEYIQNIKTAAQRGASLTRQLLSFSRRQITQPIVFDVNERLKEVSKLLRPLMGDDVEIIIQSRASAALVEADPSQFDQVMLNLAVNSRDAMAHGGKFILETGTADFDEHFVKQHPQVTTGKYILLAVSDTGCGMDETTISHIFEPFFTTKEPGKGTGLGLATVYGIVRQSGGYVWAYSEPGRGTTFKIYLPSAEHKLELEEIVEIAALPPRGEGKTILLVEDDQIMRQLTGTMLTEQGYTVLEANDGVSAWELIKSNGAHVDLVLTDVVMRGMSGPELGLRISKDHPQTRIVYMSGYTGKLFDKNTAPRSSVPLLEKPFTRQTLLEAVHAALA
jgi:PAS domain S-box-containing protein